ncbi:amino acid permease [bacterium]|nr:amino acid permease [bacterium]
MVSDPSSEDNPFTSPTGPQHIDEGSPSEPDGGVPSDHQPRKFGFWSAYFLVVASMVGAGILTSSGFTLHDTANPAGLMVIWTLGGILALCGTVTIAELATMLPRAGSDYVFVREAFGREAGIVVGWATFILGFAAPTAVVARLSATYLATPFEQYFSLGDSFITPYLESILATCFVLVLMVIHCLGHRESSRMQIATTLMKLSILVGLVVVGCLVGSGSWSHFEASHLPDWGESFTLGVGLIYVSYGYTGWNAAAYVAGEVQEPQRLLPKSLIAGCASVMVLYLLVNLMYVFALDPHEMTQLSIPEVIPVAQLAASRMFGSQIGGAISILLGLGMTASVSAYMLSGPRIAFSMASDGAFPRFAARLHDRRKTPTAAIIVQGMVAIGMIWRGSFLAILDYTAVGLAVLSGLVVASIFPLRNRSDLPHPFRMPFYPLPPILYLLLMGWIVGLGLMNDYQGLVGIPMKWPATLLSLVTILMGIPIAWALGRKRSQTVD